MKKLKELFTRYYEALAYLFFGAVATGLNILIFTLFDHFLGSSFAAGAGNVLNNAICILFAYTTNRLWVFRSKSRGKEALREFASFVFCRIGTAALDQLILWIGVTLVGPMVIPTGWAVFMVGGFSFSMEYIKLWNLGVKLFSQAVVIISNYVFSKLFIFKKDSKGGA